MKVLGTLKTLTKLSLDNTGVTDAGLKEIATLDKLTVLDLSDTKVTDAGVMELAALKGLTELNLSLNRMVTKDKVLELQKALPNCRITK